jgi:hypothetical protein
MSASRRTWRSVAAAAALAAAACKDSSAPESPLSDPAGLSAHLTQMSQPLQTPVFQSFSALDASTGPLAAAGPAAALALAARSYALESAGTPSVPEAQRAAALGRLVPAFSVQAARDSFLPDTAKGTWEWDVLIDRYVKTGPPPLPNTTRIILYVIDPVTDLPAEPVDEVGHVDITDNQPPPGGGLSVSLTVRDSAGTTTYVDYDATLTPGTNSFSANATGFVTNGLQGALNVVLTFTTAFSATQTIVGSDTTTDFSADATVTLNQSVSAEVHDDAQIVAGAQTIMVGVTRDFRFNRPGEVITVEGTVDLTVDRATEQLISATIDFTFRVNGATLARIVGTTPTNARATGPGGRDLTIQETQSVNHLFAAADQFFIAIADLFDPLEDFFFN